MKERVKAAKGTFFLSAGEFVSYGASFIRNMILARLLTKEDFGIAATLALIMTLLEFSAKLGIARFVVRDKNGDDPDFIASAHGVNAATSIFSGLCILLFSPVLAVVFDVTEEKWAIAWLALAAAFRGFEHLDVRRYERELRFIPSIMSETVPQLVMVLLAWPIANWLGDFRAVLVLMLLKAVLGCVISHTYAENPYRWLWKREYIVSMLKFGWPLLINGFLLFGVMQGEQFLVAIFYDKQFLGAFAAAMALVAAPSFIFRRVFTKVALPILAKAQDDITLLSRQYRFVIGIIALCSGVMSVGFIVGSEALVQIVYGEKYAGAGVVLGWLAASIGFRNLRTAPVLAAMARGDSKNQMICNIWRVMTIGPALIMAWVQSPIWMIAGVGLVGEAVACWVSFSRLKSRDGISISVSLWPTVLLAGVMILAGLFVRFIGVDLPLFRAVLSAIFFSVVSGGLFVLVLPNLRVHFQRFWERVVVGRKSIRKILKEQLN